MTARRPHVFMLAGPNGAGKTTLAPTLLRDLLAFETTMASRSFAPWLARLKPQGYRVHVIFLWLPSAEVAIQRVTDRVRRGGHGIAADVVRRRFHAGLRNFFGLYQPLADRWRMYDNSGAGAPRLIASGEGTRVRRVSQPAIRDLLRS